MKNARFVLKTGIVAIATIVFSTTAFSQVVNQSEGKQKNSYSVSPVSKSSAITETSAGTNQSKKVATATLNPKLAAQKRSAISVSNSGKTTKSCPAVSRANPYSISRSNFNKLPKDRQQFVLDNSNKYSIVD